MNGCKSSVVEGRKHALRGKVFYLGPTIRDLVCMGFRIEAFKPLPDDDIERVNSFKKTHWSKNVIFIHILISLV